MFSILATRKEYVHEGAPHYLLLPYLNFGIFSIVSIACNTRY